jgi:glutamate--cysteine ligase
MDKVLTLLRLTPLIQAMTANAPFIEGRRSERLSERQDVWLHMDPSRSGLLTALWDKAEPTYQDYVEWALDAGMFLIARDGSIVENTGQTFRDFIANGFDGHRATEEDWRLHLGTLFPEVRLKSTIEVRCCDSLPPRLALAVPALLTGLVYDEGSLDHARELAAGIRAEDAVALQRDVSIHGVRARYRGEPIAASCSRLLDIAERGLHARHALDGAGRDESRHLDPLKALLDVGQCPADDALARVGRFETLSLSDLERLQ